MALQKKYATLIVTKTKCLKCKPVTISDIEEYNKQKNTAVLLMHDKQPAMLRLYSSPKDVNFRVFQILSNGFQYEIQLGINSSASSLDSFNLEEEFLKIIGSANFK